MTEAEWLSCADPSPMLAAVRDRAGDRKLRLLACGCCRALWADAAADSRAAVEAAERYADGRADAAELDRAWDAAAREVDLDRWMWGDRASGVAVAAAETARAPSRAVWPDGRVHERTTRELMESAVSTAAQAAATGLDPGRAALARADICRLVGCCFGNPFRPVAVQPGWQTADVAALARGIYDERAFDRMPVLADALMDAWCADEHILEHCRGDGPHVRGCWVVDLVLGQE
jgi:hypothetical protein